MVWPGEVLAESPAGKPRLAGGWGPHKSPHSDWPFGFANEIRATVGSVVPAGVQPRYPTGPASGATTLIISRPARSPGRHALVAQLDRARISIVVAVESCRGCLKAAHRGTRSWLWWRPAPPIGLSRPSMLARLDSAQLDRTAATHRRTDCASGRCGAKIAWPIVNSAAVNCRSGNLKVHCQHCGRIPHLDRGSDS